jgi:5-oxoprolinase (ATP-hydrolysing) subunit C
MADALMVSDGGLFSTIQDAGRFGYQRFGISASGAMDRVSHQIANALVGNDPDTAAVEMTMTGLSFVVEADHCRLAVAGDMPILVNGQPMEPWRSFDTKRGDAVRLATLSSGLRAYLAVAGGFDMEPVLGSRSTHTRSGIGGLNGGPLKAGDRLPVTGQPARGECLMFDGTDRRRETAPIRVMLGPQDDYFTSAGISQFLSGAYTVTSRSDRMGCQLDGPRIEHRAGFNIVSDGIANGSIQVPGNGQPILLLADRQTTGGYPKIATVISPDLHRLGQLRPGDAIGFQAVSPDDAQTLVRAHRTDVAALLARIGPVRRQSGALSGEDLLRHNLVGGVVSGVDADGNH